MADILDMVAYRQLQRQRRRFKKDLDECTGHPSLEHHPTWEPTAEERERSAWAYGPEGLSGQPGQPGDAQPSTQEVIEDYYGKDNVSVTKVNLDAVTFEGPETAYRMGDDGKVTEVPVPGLPLADVVQLGPAKRASTLTGRYLDEIIEKALKNGALGLLAKPFEPDELLSKLESAQASPGTAH